MEPNKVVQALKVLRDEGREDLLKDGVLEQAWVGLKRPKRVSADGVSAAEAACTSPVRTGKKFRAKSAFGRKLLHSPRNDEEPMQEIFDTSFLSGGTRRGGSRFSRRHGASLAQRVAAGGRGSAVAGAVSAYGRMRARAVIAHARAAGGSKQARPSLEKGGELVAVTLEERTLRGAPKMASSSVSDSMAGEALEEKPLGAASKMAEPITIDEGEIIVILDDEEVEQVCQKGVGGQVFGGLGGVFRCGVGRGIQRFPRLFSPMLHKVQSWQMDNEAVLRLGEQVELVDGSGSVLRGTVCGETIGDGSVGRAYVSLDVSQPVSGEGTSGVTRLMLRAGMGRRRFIGHLGGWLVIRACRWRSERLQNTGLKGWCDPERSARLRGIPLEIMRLSHPLARALVLVGHIGTRIYSTIKRIWRSLLRPESGLWWREKRLVWSRAAMFRSSPMSCLRATYLEVRRAWLGF
ncbi:hypothetical protein NDU88_001909 [Pleurodeles waltl]|uniref:Uncharacterized protein n=1 Tax=Pleurodeles waltl TaxID=8319 RepID=A0AAV7LE60_PLEWA|nr:hypothetical protein NDU88_001909 [Pleurodeles waltl]